MDSPPKRARSRSIIPRPGEIFDPVARGLEVIGDRWTLVLVRQLLGGARGFQELRVRTGIAPRVLSLRLKQLVADGFVESKSEGNRSLYAVSNRGRSLEPIIAATARWWVHNGIEDLEIDTQQFTDTSAQSVVEALPFLLREDRRSAEDVVFEIRLTGEGGGVWTVAILDGQCEVNTSFAERADVRYTADARTWCGVALGLLDARDAIKRGLLTKDGGSQAMDHYFHQVSRRGVAPETEGADSDEAYPTTKKGTDEVSAPIEEKTK
ncbi:MAG: winged helix-turn-helix transcriptional regulator [Myxococcota bacterium]|jgi:DNA-binding HxlR family transcriptional regulator|nr:winged helix-turn-helix transcriptional regulator [Myxococcota bacterium]